MTQLHATVLLREIERAVARLSLDLTGLTVLTEAGTGSFVVTPVLAALAGAERVVAITRDSKYGAAVDTARSVNTLAQIAGVERRVQLRTGLAADAAAEADIVTNLGFIRPIDAEFVARMRQTAVVALMCESWEVRPADVDLDACRRKGIVCFGTNERDSKVDVFPYVGVLALQLVLEAGCPVHRSHIVVLGGDQFALTAADALSRAGARCSIIVPSGERVDPTCLANADAVLVAEYASDRPVIGESGWLRAADVQAAAPSAIIIQLAGIVDVVALEEAGMRVWPRERMEARRMSRTLAALGPRPVVELHAAGLRVGELAARARLSGEGYDAVQANLPRRHSIAQSLGSLNDSDSVRMP